MHTKAERTGPFLLHLFVDFVNRLLKFSWRSFATRNDHPAPIICQFPEAAAEFGVSRIGAEILILSACRYRSPNNQNKNHSTSQPHSKRHCASRKDGYKLVERQ